MATEVLECEFTQLCRLYGGLLQAVGLELDEAALAEHAGADAGEQEQIRSLIAVREDDELLPGDEPAAHVTDALRDIEESLAAELRGAALVLGVELPAGDELLASSLEALPEEDRERLADALLLSAHAAFVRPRYMDVPSFLGTLSADHDPHCLAMVKLVPYLREQLGLRGYSLSDTEIERFFDPAGQGRAPYCLKTIMAGVNGQFSTGLIPLEDMVGEEEPGEWLERVREKLLFRSHSAMHKAIAEATSLKYDCVHKALSGNKKAKRIQAEIKLLPGALAGGRGGGPRPADGRRAPRRARGVDVRLLSQLEQSFESKEEIYRVISERDRDQGGVGAPLLPEQRPAQVRAADRLPAGQDADGPPRHRFPGEAPAPARSYLADQATRQAASTLATGSMTPSAAGRSTGRTRDLETEFRQLRLLLIVAIKEQQVAVPEKV